jgi:hypothetical protein
VFDHLEFIDAPLVDTSKIAQLAERWKRGDRDIQNWGHLTPTQLNREITLAAKP